MSQSGETDKDRKVAAEFECAFREGFVRSVSCGSCGGKRQGAVYGCSVHGECTVLALRAKSEEGKKLPICITCDDRVDNSGNSKIHSGKKLVEDSKKLVDCVHFGSEQGTRYEAGSGEPIYECHSHKMPDFVSVGDCMNCSYKTSRKEAAQKALEQRKDKPDTSHVKSSGRRLTRAERRQKRKDERWAALREDGSRHPADVDPANVVSDRTRRPANVANLFHDSPLFLILSGPSLNLFNHDLLKMRGVVTMGVNNASAHVKTNMFIHGDPSKKFHHSIWADPSVMKFTPRTNLKRDVRIRNAEGRLEILKKVMYMPNVYGYERNSIFDPEKYLTEPTINFGNGKRGVEKNDFPKVLSTMFSAVKMAYHLGFNKVFLLGCDFRMNPYEPYAFKQSKSGGGVGGNNNSYKKINYLFSLAYPYFADLNFEVFNCYKESGLEVFPHMPFNEAIEYATSHIEQEPNTEGWYKKDE